MVLNQHPEFSVSESKDSIILSGTLIMNAEYDNIPLYDEYEVEITVSNRFPEEVPQVRELGKNIPSAFGHFYDNGVLCLGAACELYDFLAERKSLISFIDEIIISYFYSASYFKRYGTVPFGERSHGVKGIEESYMDRYSLSDRNVLMQILLYLTGYQRYRGHMECPCGSGKKFRDCHGGKLLKDIMSPLNKHYQADAFQILAAYINERKDSN